MTAKPLRSVLYMPGANQRAMDKARTLPVDAIVFDLEDAVAPATKSAARTAVVEQLTAGGYGHRQLVVRCNALGTPWWEDDVRALVAAGIETLCVPKVETLVQLQSLHSLLSSLGRPDLPLWPMIETPLGVENVLPLAQFEQVAALVMGTTDLASELRVPHTPGRIGLRYALGRCVLAARTAGKAILDGVYLELDNASGLEQICLQGRQLGFDGKTLIHPAQIDAANAAFGFSPGDVAHAKAVLEVWRSAQAAGKGVAVLNGKLIEVMHVGEATRLLDMAGWIERSASA